MPVLSFLYCKAGEPPHFRPFTSHRSAEIRTSANVFRVYCIMSVLHASARVCVCVHVPVCVWVLVCMFRISYWGLTLQTSVDEAKGKPVESRRSLTLMSDVTASGPIIDLGLKKKKRTDLSQK